MSTGSTRRLVVTGHDRDNRSRVASDTAVANTDMPGTPGFEGSVLWGADEVLAYPDEGDVPAFAGYFPPVGGARLVEVYMPPRAVFAEPSAGDVEAMREGLPGLAETMAKGRPGMHRTATTDFVIVMEGRCTLQLDAEDVVLEAGDVLVENGTIHAWSNPFDQPCRFIASIVGARHDLCA